MLKRRTEEYPALVLKYLLCTVALVDIEIDDGDFLQAVFPQRMCRTYGDIVEQAEPHRSIRLGVVAGRPHAAKG